MFYLNVTLTLKDLANGPAVAEALARTGKLSREEPGCVRWEAYRSDADPSLFLLVEHWESKEALEAHRKGRAVTEVYMKEVIPLVDRTPHPSQLIG